MKVRAAVLEAMGAAPPYAASKPLVVRDVELDAPGAGEVLVRVRAAGLCHSDLSVINGDRPRPLPMVIGHESSGEVVACGAGVDDLRPGDHVVMVFMPSCGHCLPCAEGRPALCEPGAAANTAGTLLGGHRRWRRGDVALNHHVGVSCFADHTVLSRRSCIRLEPGLLSHREASLFGCAVLTGAGAVINTAKVAAGQSVAVLGLGGVGLSALLAAVAAGARDVVAIDFSDDKLALAKTLGASATFNARAADVADAVREHTKGGVDVAFEMAGSAAAFETAWRVTRRGGATVTGGLPNPAARFALPLTQMVGEERTLRGSYIGSAVPQRDLPRYVDLYRRGRLPVDRLMGETFSLDDINIGLDRLASGSALRDAVLFD
jgi:alcohol dehydrogenase